MRVIAVLPNALVLRNSTLSQSTRWATSPGHDSAPRRPQRSSSWRIASAVGAIGTSGGEKPLQLCDDRGTGMAMGALRGDRLASILRLRDFKDGEG